MAQSLSHAGQVESASSSHFATSPKSGLLGTSVDRSASLPPVRRQQSHGDRVSSTAPSSASGSKSSSFIGTPRLLSRRGSQRDKAAAPVVVPASAVRSNSVKAKTLDDGAATNGGRSPVSETEVIETPQLRMDRDPETGRKMINQYLVLQEIGSGTHGRVRLGRDVFEAGDADIDPASPSGPGLYAIKIVDRNPRQKRLNALGRNRGAGRTDGGKLVAENEIRKELAIFKKVHHPNVVRMKEIIDDPESSKIFMVLEYCDGGEIEWKLPSGGPALTVGQTRNIFRDTLLGLEYLHHQGIIHRDIKPSNLLYSGGKVKISDFGCSHFSEALLAAAAGGEESYVNDVELAKTAGSPAFFAPEMCYSEVQDKVEPLETVPTFTIRPPSTLVDEHGERRVSTESVPYSPGRAIPKPLVTADPRGSVSRSQSAATIPTKPRHPITNAIDVWALGVTLYCLLFGKTPFDAPNEYLLMQAIPTAQYDIPSTMGSDHIRTSGPAEPQEAKEALDLLSRLLEKDATKRITLDQARHHPFTLRGLSDAPAWLASTDLRNQSFVTVTNDEVAAAVTRGSSFRERFKRSMKSLSSRFGFLGGRHRSGSVADGSDKGDHSGTETAGRRVASGNDAIGSSGSDGVSAPAPSALARKLSLLSRDRNRAESPRPSHALPAHADTSPPHGPYDGARHLAPAAATASAEATPRQMPSISSLDKFKLEASSSPTGVTRGPSLDIVEPRPRSGSNASSSAGSLLGAFQRNIFGRDGLNRSSRSVRSNNGRPKAGSAEDDDGALGTSLGSQPSAFGLGSEILRGHSYDDFPRRQSLETFESGSPSSRNLAPSPDRFGSGYEPRFRGAEASNGYSLRRGSTLSEDIRPVMEDEEVDFDGDVPDSDDEQCSEDEYDLPLASNNLGRRIGGSQPSSFQAIPSSAADRNLSHSASDLANWARSPSDSILQRVSPPNSRDMPAIFAPAYGHTPTTESPAVRAPQPQSLLRSGGGVDVSRLPATGSPHGSPHRVPPSAYRAKSPLGVAPARSHSSPPPTAAPNTVYLDNSADSSPSPTPAHSQVPLGQPAPAPASLAPAPTSDRFADADDDDDDGLVLGPRRGRKGSVLSRKSSVMSRSPH
ncbi:hypothetical protein Q8F55_006309 [Vanrija albida]|uniref:non-specific serine/threonine protein kinase n=1 Tax=Vanrija albida TaxID=181172 RepID=A0ABR3PXK1_9TREE